VLPCGHPRAILIEREIELLKWPNLEDRKLLINLTSGTGQPFFIRPLRIAGCQAASNALFISRKAQHVVIFCFLFFSISDIKEPQADSVDLFGRKPCWLSLNQLCSQASNFSLL